MVLMINQLNIFELEDMNIEEEKVHVKFIDVTKDIESDKIFTVTSLFSGCGGMDLGFRGDFKIFDKYYKRNNFNIIFANDIDSAACETYEYNFNHKPICGDIRDIDIKEIPKADVVIGGFPCQDFSIAGKRKGLTSSRGRLYLEMKRVIEYTQPKAFVAENVDGIRTLRKGTDTSALEHIINDFKNAGYDVAYQVLNAADYGVPQIRIRVIIIGIRKDLNKTIYFPKPVRKDGCLQNPWMTAKEAIDDLWDKIGSPEVFNHSEKDYSKAKFYPGKKMQGNCRIRPDRPSVTIRAEHHGNIEAHYRTTNPNNPDDMTSWRRLSVRECARLQSFPDNFVFPCSASRAYKLVGNAVPPILAWYIARALYYSLIKE